MNIKHLYLILFLLLIGCPRLSAQVIDGRNAHDNDEKSEAQSLLQDFSRTSNERIANKTYNQDNDDIVQDFIIFTRDTVFFYNHTVSDSLFHTLTSSLGEVRHSIEQDFFRNSDFTETVDEAESSVRVVYTNASRTDHFFIDFSQEDIYNLLIQMDEMEYADKNLMEEYMQYIAHEMPGYMDDATDTTDQLPLTAEFKDGVFELVYSVPEGKMNFNMTPADEGTIKNLIISVFKTSIEESFVTPEILDSVIITKEMFYQYMKGVRVLYLEENTRRANDIYITSEEIRNGKLFLTSMDSITR